MLPVAFNIVNEKFTQEKSPNVERRAHSSWVETGLGNSDVNMILYLIITI